MKPLQRRSFLKTTASAVAVSTLPAAHAAAPVSKVVVVHGKDISKMLAAGIAKLGGWDAFIKPGMKVALKPNVAWNSQPEQGGNTHPDLIKACVLAVESKGAASINIPENTCHNALLFQFRDRVFKFFFIFTPRRLALKDGNAQRPRLIL